MSYSQQTSPNTQRENDRVKPELNRASRDFLIHLKTKERHVEDMLRLMGLTKII
ncbi:hypothetical protein [Methanosalsum natronophilum]|uniref:hypothetical protein n=1 Tax=Methanosalsum natronophilum TaxID=768733 RepID=UPI002167992E|nr:hypothetical protein [Methanosalsum natronophilum]MCS3924314.1 hypothetical protein [Methanosalsum natronophilum]